MKEYIEREAAIALSKDIIVPQASGVDYKHRCIDPQDIREIPAADVVEVRHGEWRDDADKIEKHFHRHYFFCKKCNTRADYFIGGEGNWWSSCAPDYCPRCGEKNGWIKERR